MLVMYNPGWLSSEHGMDLPSASHKCPKICATSLQNLLTHSFSERKPICSQQCHCYFLVWTCLTPANGRSSGLMLTICLKARLFPLEKPTTVALETLSGKGKQYRHTAIQQGYQFSSTCNVPQTTAVLVTLSKTSYFMNLGCWSITKLATFAMHI